MDERAFVHLFARSRGLLTRSHGRSPNRCVTLYKRSVSIYLAALHPHSEHANNEPTDYSGRSDVRDDANRDAGTWSGGIGGLSLGVWGSQGQAQMQSQGPGQLGQGQGVNKGAYASGSSSGSGALRGSLVSGMGGSVDASSQVQVRAVGVRGLCSCALSPLEVSRNSAHMIAQLMREQLLSAREVAELTPRADRDQQGAGGQGAQGQTQGAFTRTITGKLGIGMSCMSYSCQR